MKGNLLRISGVIVVLIFVFSSLPQSTAAPVWSDDFNDGNYNGWTVTAGSWVVNGTDHHLTSEWTEEPHRIWHDSSTVVGTWSFDHYQYSTAGTGTWICFMTNGTDPPDDYYGYAIHIVGTNVYLVKIEMRIDLSVNIAVSLGLDLYHGWTKYDVTRNSTGGFNVYVNVTDGVTEAEPIISVVDIDYDYSERFVIHNWGWGNRIDNIVVDNEILITPLIEEPTTTEPTETPTGTTTNGGETPTPIDPLLLAIGGGVVIVIIAAVVCMKRR